MTTKESRKALKSYNELDTLIWYHNKNLTNAQYETLSKVRDTLRELSQKAYGLEKKER